MAAHLEGRAAFVVAYWATWCEPCVADSELAHLRTLRRALARLDVELVSVAIDDLGKLRSHPKRRQWLYPLWHVQDGHIKMLPRSLIDQAGLGLPLFLVVTPSGEVHYFRGGALSPAVVAEMVTAAASVRGQ